MKSFLILAAAGLAFGCGSSKGSDAGAATGTATAASTDGTPAALAGKVKLTLFGKSFYTDDSLYELSCNQYFAKFWISADSPDCKAVTVSLNFDSGTTWTIASADSKVNVKATAPDGTETLVIGGKTYHCLLFTAGGAYGSDGTEVLNSGHLVLSETAVDKPSQLDPTKVLGVGIDDQSLCSARF